MQDTICKVTSNLIYRKNEAELKFKVAENEHTQLPYYNKYFSHTIHREVKTV